MYKFFTRSCGKLVNFVFSSRSKTGGDSSTVLRQQIYFPQIVGKSSQFSQSPARIVLPVLHAKNHHVTPRVADFYPVSTAPITTIKRKVN